MTRFFGPDSESEPAPILPRLREVGGPGMAAAVLIGIATAATAVSTWTTWHGYQLVTDYLAGDPTVTVADLDAADRLISGVGWGYLIFIVIAAVVFLVWLWRARVNAEMLCEARHRRSRGWVIGSWICPIVNLWFPFMVVDDIYRASRPGTPRDLADLRMVAGSRLLAVWWTSWLAWEVIDRILLRMWRDELTVEALRTIAIVETIGVAAMIVAAVFVIMIMRRISGWQIQATQAPLSATG